MKLTSLKQVCSVVCLSLALFPVTGQAEAGSEDLRTLVQELRDLVLAQQAQIGALEEKIEDLQSRVQPAPAAARAPETSPAAVGGTRPVPAPAPAPRQTPSVTSKFDLRLYGYVKLDLAYETQRTHFVDQGYFVKPNSGSGDDDALSFTAKESRVGLAVTAPPVGNWSPSGILEYDFYGSGSQNAANPRMRLAYLKLDSPKWSLLAGQDWDSWNFLPKSVDFSGWGQHGALWSRRAQLRLTRKVALEGKDRMEFTLGLARHIGVNDIDGAGDELDGAADSGRPLVQWNVAYKPAFKHGIARFAVGGHYGWEDAEQSALNREERFITSLLLANFSLPVTPRLTLAGFVWTGENLGGYNGGIGQGLNLARNTEIAAQGGWLQAQYQVARNLRFDLTAGIDDPDDKDLGPGGRIKNVSYSANVFWEFIDSVTLALEYEYMKTSYKGGPRPVNNRFQSALIFQF